MTTPRSDTSDSGGTRRPRTRTKSTTKRRKRPLEERVEENLREIAARTGLRIAEREEDAS